MVKIKSIFTLFAIAFFSLLSVESVAQKADDTENSREVTYDGCQVFVPNAFTPNGDNLNDRFEIKYNPQCEVQEYAIRIFDRWGRLVFETNAFEQNQAWDGNSNGDEAAPGVYLWRLTMKMVNPNGDGTPVAVNKQGSLVLIR